MRLIDADKLMENKFKNDISYNAFCNLVKRQPTIDAVPQWIPCEERLPEEGVVVVTVDKDGDYEINAIIDEEDGEWFWEKAIAWMPLPKPYERKEE